VWADAETCVWLKLSKLIISGIEEESFLQLHDRGCVHNFAFSTDTTQHMKELSINLQGSFDCVDCNCDQTICKQSAAIAHAGSSIAEFSTLKMEAIRSSEMSVHIRSTRRHIPKTTFFNMIHFPILGAEDSTDVKKYSEQIQFLR
jgi:hypothetical protein